MNLLILGGTSEIAKKFCYNYLNGAKIYITARKKEQLFPLKQDLELKGDSVVEIIEFDVSTPSLPTKLQEIAPDIDLMLVAIGYLGDQEKAEDDYQEAMRIFDINFRNLIPVMNLVAQGMKQRKRGTIAGISSVAGERGRGSNFYYGSAKAALTAYLSGLRNKLSKSNVHVVTALPGFIDTKMTSHLTLPKPLTAAPEEVARSIYKAVLKKKNKVYILPVWKWIMLIIRSIPEPVFKKMNL